MRRKLVRMGKHTLMAAIPSSWVRKHNLGKGDAVEFTEFGNKLVLTSTTEIFERQTSLHIPSPKIEVVWRMLQPTYTSGYDEVRVSFDDPRTLQTIEGCIQQLIGFELVEVGEGTAVIKSLSAQLDEELTTVLGRTWNVAMAMAQALRASLSDRKRLAEIRPMELTVNRYTMFLKRVMNRTGYKYPQYTYQIVAFLELAANHVEYLRKYLHENPKLRIERAAVEEAARLEGLFRAVHQLYAKYTEERFRLIAEEQPHFKWFTGIKDPVIRMHYTAAAEYLVQIARQVQALHT